MSWFKVDDGLHTHPKAAKAGLAAMGLWVLCGSYCADTLSDGVVPWEIVVRYAGSAANAKTLAAKLIKANLWTARGEDVVFVDYHDRNPTREAVLAAREKAGQRVGRHRQRKGASERVNADPDSAVIAPTFLSRPENDARQIAPRALVTESHFLDANEPCNGVTNAVANAGVTGAPDPDPVGEKTHTQQARGRGRVREAADPAGEGRDADRDGPPSGPNAGPWPAQEPATGTRPVPVPPPSPAEAVHGPLASSAPAPAPPPPAGDAATLLAELRRHPALAAVATATLAEGLAGRALGRGTKVSWLVTAIDEAGRDAAAQAAVGHPVHAQDLARMVVRYADRARAPAEAPRGQALPRGAPGAPSARPRYQRLDPKTGRPVGEVSHG